LAEIVCDCDSCKHYENGRCGLAVVEICGGHCRDLDGEQEDFENEKENRL
jgi:hypothetical protein